MSRDAIKKLSQHYPRPTARDQRGERQRALLRDRELVLQLRARGLKLAEIAEVLRRRGTVYRGREEPLTESHLSTLLYRTGLNGDPGDVASADGALNEDNNDE